MSCRKSAPYSAKSSHRPVGMVFLVLGFVAVFGGLILVFTWSLMGLLGLLLIIGGSALMATGYLQMTGFFDVTCPYCGAHGTLSPRATVFKCAQCKHTSVRRNDCLEETK